MVIRIVRTAPPIPSRPTMPSPYDRTEDPEPKGPNKKVDEALEETFPASDPPSYSGGAITPQDAEVERKPADPSGDEEEE